MVWGRAVLKLDPLSAAHAEAASFDDSHWTDATVPGSWTGDLGNFDGIVWMRRQVEIPAAWVGRELELDLGPIDDDDRTWFDGELVGATEGWDTPRKYPIPAARVQAGKATIAVRILDTGGFGGFHGEAAAMLLRPKTGAEKISLAGSWRMSRGAALAELPPKPPVFALGGNTPTALFNGMIAPLAEFRFAGAIWYQGESNVGRAEEYAKLFPAMIQDWRANFHSELPFLYVQIAPFGYGNDSGAAGDLRAAQAEALALPKTGMAITVDIGDPADIHPKNKQEVGKRLAALALAPDFRVHYPLADAPHNDAGRVKLEFHEVLEACGPSVFELAGADGKFRPATQEVSPEGEVFVFSTEVSAPTRLRYAWGAAAAGSLRSAETKLPVAPFKADCGP